MRRGLAVVGALAAFGACYWGLGAAYPKMDTGIVLGWSALPLTVVLGVLLAWAERSKPGDGAQEVAAVSVVHSPGGQAVGQVEGVSVGTGVVITNPVINLATDDAPVADVRAAAGTPGLVSLDPGGDTLPSPNPTFSGRVAALESLERRLVAGPVAVVVLRGLGGVGK